MRRFKGRPELSFSVFAALSRHLHLLASSQRIDVGTVAHPGVWAVGAVSPGRNIFSLTLFRIAGPKW